MFQLLHIKRNSIYDYARKGKRRCVWYRRSCWNRRTAGGCGACRRRVKRRVWRTRWRCREWRRPCGEPCLGRHRCRRRRGCRRWTRGGGGGFGQRGGAEGGGGKGGWEGVPWKATPKEGNPWEFKSIEERREIGKGKKKQWKSWSLLVKLGDFLLSGVHVDLACSNFSSYFTSSSFCTLQILYSSYTLF